MKDESRIKIDAIVFYGTMDGFHYKWGGGCKPTFIEPVFSDLTNNNVLVNLCSLLSNVFIDRDCEYI
jgi:hypothetical protein